LYGYRCDPAHRRWAGGDLLVSRPGPYPDGHDSPAAYGNRVAGGLGGHVVTVACSGASDLNGAVAAHIWAGFFGPTRLRPAQFGDGATG
jgi:hypothetical protein